MKRSGANIKGRNDTDLRLSVGEYQEVIIEMVKGISRTNSIKMLYGFTKRLYQEEKAGD